MATEEGKQGLLGKGAEFGVWSQTETGILIAIGEQIREPQSTSLGLLIWTMGMGSRPHSSQVPPYIP